MDERRNLSRRNFSYYMRVTNEMTGDLVGHLADISTTGFRLDCPKELSTGSNLRLRIEQTGVVSTKNFVSFVACVKWCKRDEYDFSMYNIGFQLVTISRADYDAFLKMFETYGVQKPSNQDNSTQYFS